MNLHLVAPPLGGPPTGGTVYNARLVAALREQGIGVTVADVVTTLGGAARIPAGTSVWLDTLYLEDAAAVGSALAGASRLGLLVHYLPSLVEHGETLSIDQLCDAERTALGVAERFCVPSRFMAAVLERLGVAPDRVGVVEPGHVAPAAVHDRSDGPLRVVVVANLTEGKGVAELLDAVARRAAAEPVEISVVGGRPDPRYARACDLAAAAARRRGLSVVMCGGLEPDACIRRVAGADVLASASRMESFGMALADARAAGVPIVARGGGNVRQLVTADAGGELVADTEALADAILGLARSPAELARRRRMAQAARIRRTWADVAADFRRWADGSGPGSRAIDDLPVRTAEGRDEGEAPDGGQGPGPARG